MVRPGGDRPEENGVERDYVGDDDTGRPNRREFIRRSAIAVGLTAWTVPLVQMVRTHSHGNTPAPSPEQMGVRAITAACTSCTPECESVAECGTNGLFVCFCVPVPGYPLATCLCASEVVCEDAIPCSDGCPPGWACFQGCCDFPVCLPPCPDEQALLAAAQAAEAPSGRRLTVTGRRI